MEEKDKQQIDLIAIFKLLLTKRKTFFKIWVYTFVISCVIILPQPRYYDSKVVLIPEASAGGEGGLASIASSFGFNIGGIGSSDAIYPQMYPELFNSNAFIVDLLDIQIKAQEIDYEGDYYTYLKSYQKTNWLTAPFKKCFKWVKNLFATPKPEHTGMPDPFRLSEKELSIVTKIQNNIACSVDKKDDMITLVVRDQDPLVCALLADSIKFRLQNFITNYRTSKARLDEEYYKKLADDAFAEYTEAAEKYNRFVETHANASMQSYLTTTNLLQNEMDTKLSTYNALSSQLLAARAKIQEKTPAFTTINNAAVPIKPAGPKRMLFVAGMLILSTIAAGVWISRHMLFGRR